MSLQIHLRVEYHELLLLALGVEAGMMIFVEMPLQRVVVLVVLRILAAGPSIAQMASLVLLSAVRVELVVAIESPPTEAALRMALEPALIDRAGVIVTELLVFPQLILREELMLVREDLLVPRAQVAHYPLMRAPNMAMQVRPAHARDIARRVRAVVPEQEEGIFEDLGLLVCDAQIVVLLEEVGRFVLLVSLLILICEDHRRGFRPTVRTSFGLVERSEP